MQVQSLEGRLAPATLLHALYPDSVGPQDGAEFGYAVATDSKYRVVGAPRADVSGLVDVGQAFVFDAITNNLIATLNNPSPAAVDFFGQSVAVSGNLVVVGAPLDDTGANDSGSVYVYDMNSPSPTTPIAILANPAPALDDRFGNGVAISGTWVVVGAFLDDAGAMNAGSAYVYDLASSTPAVPLVTLNNPSPHPEDNFGKSVAIEGKYVVIGADRDDTSATNAGSVYIYDLTSGTPTIPAMMWSGIGSSANFGNAVAISGNRVVVGSYNFDSSKSGGSAYVFDFLSPTPTVPIRTLINPTPTPGQQDYFGWSVAISGNHVVVGAMSDDYPNPDAGHAYAYDLSSLTPSTPTFAFFPPPPSANAQFGYSVGVRNNSVIIGANLDDIGVTNSGSVRVYDLASPTPSNPIATLSSVTAATRNDFGVAVAVSGDIMVVGADLDDTGAENAGKVYVYDLSSITPTIPIFTLSNPTPALNDRFGISVAVSGQIVVVGAFQDDEVASDAGAAYVYDLGSVTPTIPVLSLTSPNIGWSWFGISVAASGHHVVVGASLGNTSISDSGAAFVYDLTSPFPNTPVFSLNYPDPTIGDYFGYSVAIDGQYVAVGAFWNDHGATDAGSAYVYDLSSATPSNPILSINNPNPADGDRFGNSVAISGTTLVIGAWLDDVVAMDSGAAYIFDLTSPNPTVPTHIFTCPAQSATDYFGGSVAISGQYVVVGAARIDVGAMDAGAAFLYDLTALAATPVATINNPNPAANDRFGVSVRVSDHYMIVGAYNDDDQNTDQGSARVYSILPNTKVSSLLINEGDSQRSRVTSLRVNFNEHVNFLNSPVDAFQLYRQGDGANVMMSAIVDDSASGTVATLSFVGGAVEFGSLADGRYTLTILANQVTNANGPLDGNGDGVGGDDYMFQFHRLFGDGNGDGKVDAADFASLISAYGQPGLTFDFDGNNQVTAIDFNAFRLRYGASV